MKVDKEIKFDIVEKIAILSTDSKGWSKELNLVSWNDAEPKFDIRSWSEDHSRMGKGITLSEEEVSVLLEVLKTKLES
ncbi:YdbC family protein [Flexilinea flocculi]|uniref:Transcriptional coactivator p15 (PC4) C-terminal domain-containing protein n=1 Tax=Flexilinea flocculi TaxID=1678840 RepID=A0A0S7BZ15_9CHLR|nr:PC4/YdbC family ssDNA-binding protein [Flexilinea flocculi]GAP41864.1 uncharacterized protein ATC1_131860 [Flexilinea flocculi]